jgi:broad specificity phosphatase PhoE
MTTHTLPTVYLARHGETAWSKSGQHTGRTDIPLTPKGEADAARIGTRLAGINFAHVFSSPLQRARRTAELAGFAPVREPELLEWDYGECEGLKTAQIREVRPGWDLFRDGAPGGESVQAIQDRLDGLVGRLKALSGNVLLFAHGHVLRVLAARWVGQPVPFGRALLLSTATVSVLGFDHHAMDEPAIKLWNDDRHLAQ